MQIPWQMKSYASVNECWPNICTIHKWSSTATSECYISFHCERCRDSHRHRAWLKTSWPAHIQFSSQSSKVRQKRIAVRGREINYQPGDSLRLAWFVITVIPEVIRVSHGVLLSAQWPIHKQAQGIPCCSTRVVASKLTFDITPSVCPGESPKAIYAKAPGAWVEMNSKILSSLTISQWKHTHFSCHRDAPSWLPLLHPSESKRHENKFSVSIALMWSGSVFMRQTIIL